MKRVAQNQKENKRYLPHELTTKVNSVKLYRQTRDVDFVLRRYHISKASLMRWNTFAMLALENGMDVKTLSAMLGHVSTATTLDIYTHITDDMQRQAAINIDRGIGKATPQEDALSAGQETVPPQTEKPKMTDFKPYMGRKRKPGTGCVTELNDHLFEGRYSPKWPDGKKHSRDVYAHTREECEEKLKTAHLGDESRDRGSPAAKGSGRRRWRTTGGEERETGEEGEVKRTPARAPGSRYPCRRF